MAIAVEGETEEEFVNKLLGGHLRANGIETRPVLLGGNVTVQRLAREMADLIWTYDYVTSLVDFYGFSGKGDMTTDQLQCELQRKVDERIGRSWNETRVFPYVQRHEFEGLLFSNVEGFTTLLAEDVDAARVGELRRIRLQFATPEDINDCSTTAPSKRIVRLIPRYNKRVDGPIVAEATGLCRIRAECLRFDEWVTRLESLNSVV